MNELNILNFDCPRTCPRFERVDRCRFVPLIRLIGGVGSVNSHTVKVRVEFSNAAALAAAVAALGGEFIGCGEFELFERERGGNRQKIAGLGFRLPGWNYPLIAQPGGDLAFDNFEGYWGNIADLDRLRAEYAAAAAVQAAAALGWAAERLPAGGVRVFHPAGGFLDVDAAGGVDANGFGGVGCHSAAAELAAAIGKPIEFQAKAEFYQTNQAINVIGG
jgi:hypothetical protein